MRNRDRLVRLRKDIASTQVVSRDRHAKYVQQLALLGASIEIFAVKIRNLQRIYNVLMSISD